MTLRMAMPSPTSPDDGLPGLAWSFLRLGTVAFGGPPVHLAMMRREFVERRKWLTEREFLDRIALANLIPGPSSTEVAIHIGFLRAGWAGLLLAGVCFIFPAFLTSGLLAALYLRAGSLPQVAQVLSGVTPVVVAIIVQTVWSMGRSSLKSPVAWALGVLALGLFIAGAGPLPVLVGCGLAAALVRQIGPGTPTTASVAPGLFTIFLTFAKTGSVIFGGGYLLLAFLQQDMVLRTHWLTSRQLLDAIAIGQVTPGPVFSTATFLGYLLGGWPGAVAATAGIFAPGFLCVAGSGVLMRRLRNSEAVNAVLSGVGAGSIALLAYAAVFLGRVAIHDWISGGIATCSLVLLFRWRINSAWLMLGGAVAGALSGAR